jgi:Zn-dependent M28 family amino/carboxypeptidase
MRDDGVAAALEAVSGNRLREDVERLVRFKDRSAGAGHIGAVAGHVRKRFLDAGFAADAVRLNEFPFESRQHNVVCGPETFGRPAILVGAHYDSTSSVNGNAPGADDNASGVAAVLELARLLRGRPLTHDLVLAAFGAEEVNCSGSRHLASVAVARRWPLVLMINLDMIAYPANPARVVVECEMRPHRTPHSDAASRAFGVYVMQMATSYTSLTPEADDIRGSDYLSFEEMGFPCVGLFEGGDNPHKHTPGDTVSTLNFEYLRQVVQIALATILTLAR